MKRGTLNFFVDAVTLLVAVALAATGLLERYVLPPGSGRHRATLGLTRHEWGDLHFWLAVAAIGLVFVHLALHWRWVFGMCRTLLVGAGRRKKPGGLVASLMVVGVPVALVVLVGGFLWIAAANVTETTPAGRGRAALVRHDTVGDERVCAGNTDPASARCRDRRNKDQQSLAKNCGNCPSRTSCGPKAHGTDRASDG